MWWKASPHGFSLDAVTGKITCKICFSSRVSHGSRDWPGKPSPPLQDQMQPSSEQLSVLVHGSMQGSLHFPSNRYPCHWSQTQDRSEWAMNPLPGLLSRQKGLCSTQRRSPALVLPVPTWIRSISQQRVCVQRRWCCPLHRPKYSLRSQ